MLHCQSLKEIRVSTPAENRVRNSSSILSQFVSHIDMMSSINLFQRTGVVLLCLSIARSILAMKILAKATAIFLPIAVPTIEDNLFR